VYEDGLLDSQDQQEFTNSTSEPKKSAVSEEERLGAGGDRSGIEGGGR
jgi:hypothetical protein